MGVATPSTTYWDAKQPFATEDKIWRIVLKQMRHEPILRDDPIASVAERTDHVRRFVVERR